LALNFLAHAHAGFSGSILLYLRLASTHCFYVFTVCMFLCAAHCADI